MTYMIKEKSPDDYYDCHFGRLDANQYDEGC